MDSRALRNLERLLEHVVRLPVEVVLRHREQRLPRTVRQLEDVVPPLAAHVRVREDPPQRDVLTEAEVGVNLIVGGARWNRELAVQELRGEDLALRRFLREDQSHL